MILAVILVVVVVAAVVVRTLAVTVPTGIRQPARLVAAALVRG